jgi:hypothetical protein
MNEMNISFNLHHMGMEDLKLSTIGPLAEL